MKFTMSKAGLLLHCRYPFAEERKWPWEKPSPAAQKGNAVHAEIDAYVRSEVRPKSSEALAAVRYLQLSVSDGTEMRSEVGFAWNWVKDTARVLPDTGKHRDYSSLTSEEVAGTADLLLYPARGWLPTLLDWKTGRERDESAQLALLGHVARLASEVVRLDSFAVYLRADAPAKPVHYPVPDHANAVRSALSLIPGSEPNPGPWCQDHFCPLRKTCPARQPGYVAKPFAELLKKPQPKEERTMSKLSQIKSGKIKAPLRIFLYGIEGSGKSTFASGAPKPVWIGSEAGTHHLSVDRLPQPTSWEDLLVTLAELRDEKHEFKTVVLDTLNWFEPLCHAFVCKRDGKADLESFGYGRGWLVAANEWRHFIGLLDELVTKREMNVIVIAHCAVKKMKSPDSEDVDRFVPALDDRASALFKQWSDHVLFLRMRQWTVAAQGAPGKFKGKSDGQREILTQWSATADAKTRPAISSPIAADYQIFAKALEAALGKLDELKAKLEEMLKGKDEEMVARCRTYCAEDPVSTDRLEEVIRVLGQTDA